MALYMTIVVRSLLRLVRERDPFIRLAGTGLAVLLGMQALINMGVAVRLLPAKGMTLPLISYGGSSLIAAGLGLGVLLAMTRKRPQHDIDDILGRRAERMAGAAPRHRRRRHRRAHVPRPGARRGDARPRLAGASSRPTPAAPATPAASRPRSSAQVDRRGDLRPGRRCSRGSPRPSPSPGARWRASSRCGATGRPASRASAAIRRCRR